MAEPGDQRPRSAAARPATQVLPQSSHETQLAEHHHDILNNNNNNNSDTKTNH